MLIEESYYSLPGGVSARDAANVDGMEPQQPKTNSSNY
jgi:hypothetical protein